MGGIGEGTPLHEKLEGTTADDCQDSAMPSGAGSPLSSAGPPQHIPNSPPWILGDASSTLHTPQDPHGKEMYTFLITKETFP